MYRQGPCIREVGLCAKGHALGRWGYGIQLSMMQ